MRNPALLALTMTLALAACGGGGSSLPSTQPGGGSSTQSQTENAISMTNALGTPIKASSDFNEETGGSAPQALQTRTPQSYTLGTCVNGVEFFAPDKNGDPNSTQTRYFYDSGCTQLARDVVRIYAIDGTSETVNRTEKQYAIDNGTAIAQRTSTIAIVNGAYGEYGYPIVADGFDRSAASQLDLSGTKTILADDEFVLEPGSGGLNDYCTDSAGYNATGFAKLGETFGWQGGASNGTRTVNGDGSVTWLATHAGSTFKGAIGSLSIGAGTANTACPISTPEYTLAGGTQIGSYSIPVSITFKGGWLVDLTVSNATLSNGDTLDVTTNASLPPANSDFISGTISSGTTQIATFDVDAFGDGTLTITSSGTQYVIDDWHVVR
jgi:hypothetical protein